MTAVEYEHYGTHDYPVLAVDWWSLSELAQHFAEQLTGDPHAEVTLVVGQDPRQCMEDVCSIVVERPIPEGEP